MRIVQARDHRMPLQIDNLRPVGGKTHDAIVATGRQDLTMGDRHRLDLRVLSFESMNFSVSQNQCGSLRHNNLLRNRSGFFQPSGKQTGYDGHPEPDHQRNHTGIIDQMQE